MGGLGDLLGGLGLWDGFVLGGGTQRVQLAGFFTASWTHWEATLGANVHKEPDPFGWRIEPGAPGGSP